MTKLEAIIQPTKFEAVKEALLEIGVEGMTVFEVRGHGRQKGHTEFYRGREYSVDLLPKVKIEIVLADRLVEKAIEVVTNTARTGKIGDGKIFLSRVDEAIRIRKRRAGRKCVVRGLRLRLRLSSRGKDPSTPAATSTASAQDDTRFSASAVKGSRTAS